VVTAPNAKAVATTNSSLTNSSFMILPILQSGVVRVPVQERRRPCYHSRPAFGTSRQDVKEETDLDQQRSKAGIPITFAGLAFPVMRDGASRLVRRDNGSRGRRAASRALITPSRRRVLDLGGRRKAAAAPLLPGTFKRIAGHFGMAAVSGRGERAHGDILRLTLHALEDYVIGPARDVTANTKLAIGRMPKN
jgi:hypothetical protein